MSPEEADVVKQIESERGDRLLALILYFVFAAGFFALGTCLMAIWGNDPALSSLAHYVIFALGAILVLIVTPILLRHGLRQRKLYRARFYQLITPLLTAKDYRSFTFLARPSVKSLSMPLRKVLSATPDLDSDSFFQGEIEGAKFYSFGYSYVANEKGHTKEAEGRFIEFTLQTPFAFELVIKDRRSANYYKKKALLIRLKSDSSSFDAIHDVTANAEVAGLNLLSPFLIQGITCLNNRYHSKLSAHIDGNKVQVYVDDCPARFRLSLGEKFTEEKLNRLKEETRLPYAVYLGLGLDSSFYSI